ncbi:MAG: NAD-dependent malic enzyme [Endozoicomonadaceae bacterium]|nr:NAD-dependent malic enzyme [Endozoicomonadaceae bacterium]
MRKIKSTLIKTSLHGRALLRDPIFNKGTAFSEKERTELHLHGLLPFYIEDLDTQCARILVTFNSIKTRLLKYRYLRSVQDTNETLFYALITKHFSIMLPYIYTPTIADACKQFGAILQEPRGLFIAWSQRQYIANMLDSVKIQPEVLIVTDGERILGIGDFGVNGLNICIGKLSIYTALGGFDPAKTLPVVLDVGSNNQALLSDSNYLGWKHKRIDEISYDVFWADFLQSVHKKWPTILIHFEDLHMDHALKLMRNYQQSLCCFNDDAQGTAAIVTGCLLAALKRAKQSLKMSKIIIVGAGTAGCGIAMQLNRFFQQNGVIESHVQKHLYLVDKEGLLVDSMGNLNDIQKQFAQPANVISHWMNETGMITLDALIDYVKPNILIGVTGVEDLFSESMIRRMAQYHEHPIIFPLSNPTQYIEAIPSNVLHWSQYKAFIATGSPFEAIVKDGVSFSITQCNNIYIFPALGLAVKMIQALRITDRMLDAAAYTLSDVSPVASDNQTGLLPSLDCIPKAIQSIALAVAKTGIEEGVAQHTVLIDELENRMQAIYWKPIYPSLEPLTSE